jgi:hypothetical protein
MTILAGSSVAAAGIAASIHFGPLSGTISGLLLPCLNRFDDSPVISKIAYGATCGLFDLVGSMINHFMHNGLSLRALSATSNHEQMNDQSITANQNFSQKLAQTLVASIVWGVIGTLAGYIAGIVVSVYAGWVTANDVYGLFTEPDGQSPNPILSDLTDPSEPSPETYSNDQRPTLYQSE